MGSVLYMKSSHGVCFSVWLQDTQSAKGAARHLCGCLLATSICIYIMAVGVQKRDREVGDSTRHPGTCSSSGCHGNQGVSGASFSGPSTVFSPGVQ